MSTVYSYQTPTTTTLLCLSSLILQMITLHGFSLANEQLYERSSSASEQICVFSSLMNASTYSLQPSGPPALRPLRPAGCVLTPVCGALLEEIRGGCVCMCEKGES